MDIVHDAHVETRHVGGGGEQLRAGLGGRDEDPQRGHDAVHGAEYQSRGGQQGDALPDGAAAGGLGRGEDAGGRHFSS